MKPRLIVWLVVAAAVTSGIVRIAALTRGGREDCTPYNAAALRLTDEGAPGWLISREDGARLLILDTKEDADVMMRVFKAHSALCYVGRDNKRPNRDRYVHHYWK